MRFVLRRLRKQTVFALACAHLCAAMLLISGAGAEEKTSPKIMARVFEIARQRFFYKSEADFPEMLKKGLNNLETNIDEVLVDWPEEGRKFELVVGQNKKSFRYRDPRSWNDLEKISSQAFSFVHKNADSGEKNGGDIEYAMVNGMFSAVDRHTRIIPPREYKEFKVETEGSFTGLGIVISSRKGWITVVSPIEDTPAYRAGMKSGDKIVQIENESTVNMSIEEAVSKLRGPKGKPVNIRILRDSLTKPKLLTIVRDVIKIESVEEHLFSDGILYLKIKNFQRNTTESAVEALIKRKKKERLTGIILDFRDNPGGLLNQAAEISDLFLKYGTVFSVKKGDEINPYPASGRSRFELREKTVVLVNSGSASASEIVTGALKENDRALTMGTKTFGKGSIQDIVELSDGSAFKLTIAKYLIPGDISIHKVGITPDIFIEEVDFSEDMAIYKTPEFEFRLEQYRKDYIDDKMHREPEPPSYAFKILNESLTREYDEDDDDLPRNPDKKEKRKNWEKDPLILAARRIITESKGVDRSDMLQTASRVLESIREEENGRIKEKLEEFKVDWSDDGKKTEGEIKKANLKVTISPESRVFKAGEEAELQIKVENLGGDPVYKLTAVTDSENFLFDGREFIFGKISPGENAGWKSGVEIPKNARARDDECVIRFFDSSGKEVFSQTFTVAVEERNMPAISYNYEIVDDGRFGSKGNGDGRISADETITLLFRIKNTGLGVSEDLGLYLKNKSGEKLFLEKAIEEIGEIKPGEEEDVAMRFHFEKGEGDEIPEEAEFELMANDFESGFSAIYGITVPIEKGEEFSGKRGSVKIPEDTEILGGGFDGAVPVFLAKAGSSYRVRGNAGEWLKIKTGRKRAGWIKTALTSPLESGRPRPGLKYEFEGSPVISIDKHVSVTDKNEIEISGTVKDMEMVVNISFFNNDDKIHIINSREKERSFSFTVPLEDGINEMKITAKDTSDLETVRTFYVRKKI